MFANFSIATLMVLVTSIANAESLSALKNSTEVGISSIQTKIESAEKEKSLSRYEAMALLSEINRDIQFMNQQLETAQAEGPDVKATLDSLKESILTAELTAARKIGIFMGVDSLSKALFGLDSDKKIKFESMEFEDAGPYLVQPVIFSYIDNKTNDLVQIKVFVGSDVLSLKTLQRSIDPDATYDRSTGDALLNGCVRWNHLEELILKGTPVYSCKLFHFYSVETVRKRSILNTKQAP